MKKSTLFLVLSIIVLLVGVYFLVIKRSGGPINTSDLQVPSSREARRVEGYKGNVLSGKKSYYLEYNKEDYEKALLSDKVIFLDFYATWCPTCRVEEPELQTGFDELDTDKVIGFRVNWQDEETDQDEKDLAKKLGVTSQMTKFILVEGQVVFGPRVEIWERGDLHEQLNQYL